MWNKMQLSNVCTIKKGSQVNRTALSHSGDYYVLNGGMEPSGYLDRYNTEANTISISEGGNSCGYVAYNTEPFWSGGHNYTLSELEIEKLYLYYFLKCNESKIMNLRVGSGLPNIQRKMIEAFPVYYPVDIKEQRRIAAVLNAIDEFIVVSRALVEKYDAVKQGLMQVLLTGTKRLTGFSDDWKLMKLSDLCWIPTSLVDPRLPAYCDLPHIGSENIEKGTGRLLKYHTAREDGIISGKYPFTDKDVLYSKIRPHLEKASYPRFSGVCGADIYPLRCTEKAIPEYLLYILLSEHFTSYSVSVSMRSKMPKVNQNELYAYALMMPSPQEQIAITDVLAAADERLNAELEKLIKLENIKRGLMDDLLTNRVSTDKLQGGCLDG